MTTVVIKCVGIFWRRFDQIVAQMATIALNSNVS